jgi:Rho-binding antiterminator
MSDYRPIDCRLHDRLEVCCLYRYRVRIAARDGRIVTGEARTTVTDAGKREWLIVCVNERDERVPMDGILHLDVLTPGAKVDRLSF